MPMVKERIRVMREDGGALLKVRVIKKREGRICCVGLMLLG